MHPVWLQREQARRVTELPEVRCRPRRVRLQQRHHCLAVCSKLSRALHSVWQTFSLLCGLMRMYAG